MYRLISPSFELKEVFFKARNNFRLFLHAEKNTKVCVVILKANKVDRVFHCRNRHGSTHIRMCKITGPHGLLTIFLPREWITVGLAKSTSGAKAEWMSLIAQNKTTNQVCRCHLFYHVWVQVAQASMPEIDALTATFLGLNSKSISYIGSAYDNHHLHQQFIHCAFHHTFDKGLTIFNELAIGCVVNSLNI